ncbi:MAG TPA: 30S ribosomal protein S4 [Candidatus Limnocylindrales bacterium]|nr:30S ribosomal protein S4 [Candidatus Limnocylindrales bacterium]
MTAPKTSVCKLCRREGVKLFLKASRCETSKCAITKRNFPPGAHPWARARHSEYRTQLREKQKLKRYYGVMERQFAKYFDTASRMTGNTGVNLLLLLERRLDNVIYGLGFAASRKGARQLVAHGHVHVNGRRCDLAAALLRPGDKLAISGQDHIRKLVKEAVEQRSSYPMPGWLERDPVALEGRLTVTPNRSDVSFDVREQLIVELMSK